ncbi:MAG TPA: F0F1 ATP synthase subunit delta, partial [Vampirovibrionales bacterium]
EILSADLLSAPEKAELQKALEIALNKSVKLAEKTDKELIAGILIKTQNYVLDNTLKGKLNKIKRFLVSQN